MEARWSRFNGDPAQGGCGPERPLSAAQQCGVGGVDGSGSATLWHARAAESKSGQTLSRCTSGVSWSPCLLPSPESAVPPHGTKGGAVIPAQRALSGRSRWQGQAHVPAPPAGHERGHVCAEQHGGWLTFASSHSRQVEGFLTPAQAPIKRQASRHRRHGTPGMGCTERRGTFNLPVVLPSGRCVSTVRERLPLVLR